MIYAFAYKNSTLIYAYTNRKETAKDFKFVTSDKFRMLKFSDDDISEGINLPPGGNILYYILMGEDKERYTIPMTESEANQVMEEGLEIYSLLSYIASEILVNNKFGLKNKYLNLIKELTTDLINKDYEEYIESLLRTTYCDINSLKIYQDLFNKNED